MQEGDLTSGFKVLTILYYALGGGLLLSAFVFYMVSDTSVNVVDPDLAGILAIVVPVFALSSFAVGKYMYATQAALSKEKATVSEKLNYYRTACLMRWASLEGAGLFSGVVYLLTGDLLFMAFLAMILVWFLLSKPSMSKFQQDF